MTSGKLRAVSICLLSATPVFAEPSPNERALSRSAGPHDVNRQLLSLRDTIAGRQFEALRDIREARQMGLADDVAVRAVLSRAELPESQLSPEAMEAGCREHLRREWTIVWNARAEAARQTSPGALAASLSAASGWRTRLDAEAAEVGLSFEALFPDGLDVAPAPIDPPPASASVEEMKVYLLRALLNPPTPQSNVRDIVVWAAEVADAVKSTPLGPRLMQAALPWSHVLQAPDDEVLEAAVEFASGPAGQAHAGDICVEALRPGPRRDRFDSSQLLKLILAAPEQTVVEAIAHQSTLRGIQRPFPVEWAFDRQIPPVLRRALAGVFADDPQFLAMIFRDAEDRGLDALRDQVLDAYVSGRVRLMPDLASLMPVIGSSRYPAAIRKKALEVLCIAGGREDEAGTRARRQAESLIASSDDPEVRRTGEAALRRIDEQRAVRETERQASVEPKPEDLQRIRQEARDAEKPFDRVLQDPNATEAQKAGAAAIKTKFRTDHAMFELDEVHRQLREYASQHEGLLPDALSVVTTAPEVRECAIIYFPAPGVKLASLGDDVILAMTSEPLSLSPMPKGEVRSHVVLLLGNGQTRFSLPSSFPGLWARSNAARQAAGAPPVSADQLGAVAAWLQPATRPQ